MILKRSLLIFNFLIICLTIFTYCAHAWPQHAGTCDVEKVDKSPHAGNNGANIVKGNGGYKITVNKEKITVSGPEAIHGILIYVNNKDGKRYGEFELNNKMLQYKPCDGIGEHNTITHTSKDPKPLPLELKWKPGNSNFGESVVRAVVVIGFSHWYHLDDVKFKPS